MAKPNIIESGIQPVSNQDILRKTDELCALFVQIVETALGKINQAEKIAVERLEKYVPQDRLLTLKEAAVYLGFKWRTLDSWTSPSRPPLVQYAKFGGEKRFKKQWLDQAIESGAVKPRGVKL